MNKWRVTNQMSGEQRVYATYRLINLKEPMHGGNIQYGSEYLEDEAEARQIADELNALEENK